MVDTDDTRRTMDDVRRTTPGVWHKLPTGELIKTICSSMKICIIFQFDNIDISNLAKISTWPQNTQIKLLLESLDFLSDLGVNSTLISPSPFSSFIFMSPSVSSSYNHILRTIIANDSHIFTFGRDLCKKNT